MTTLLLTRHGRSTANAQQNLAGRRRGVDLDAVGREQARTAGERLAGLPVARLFCSPLERCQQTAALMVAGSGGSLPAPEVVESITECDYGGWTGRPLAELMTESLWQTIQTRPSAARFPGGESMSELWARATGMFAGLAKVVAERSGPDAIWVAVSHGDLLKMTLANALGMQLDAFQRIIVDPGSISVIHYRGEHASVAMMNTTAGDLGHLRPPAGSGPVVGGGLGTRLEAATNPEQPESS